MRILRLVLLLPMLALAACASSASFQQPITDFAAATATASTALQSLDQAAAGQYNALEMAEAVRNPRLIIPKQGECRMSAKACTLVDTRSRVGSPPLPLQVKSLVPNSVAVMAAVSAYANGLQTTVNADSTAAVQDGLGKSLGAAITIANAVGSPTTGTLVTAIKQPLTDVAVWGFQLYQNDLKVEALQRATTAADPTIQAAMALFGQEYGIIQNANVARAFADYQAKANGAWASSGSGAQPAITTLQNSADTFDSALKLRSTNVYAQVAEAHHKLMLALQDPQVSLTDAIAQIQVLVQQIQNLQTIAAKIQAANAKPSTP